MTEGAGNDPAAGAEALFLYEALSSVAHLYVVGETGYVTVNAGV